MYKSRNVKVAFVAIAASTFIAGCGEDATCTDVDGVVVDNTFCDDEQDFGGGSYFVYYGAKVSGGKVKGGKKYAASSSEVRSRGGFGAAARSSGSGSRSTGS